jgi:outer membrane protein TolC
MLPRSWWIALLVAGAPRGAGAAPLTEAEVIRRARERDPTALLARAEAELARAEAIAPGLHPNPSVEWEREAIVGAAGATDDFLRLEVPVALSGRRFAESALAQSRADVLAADSAAAVSDAIAEALQAFYAVAYANEETRIFHALAVALEEAARILARREEQGTASGYERARLDLEAELAKSDVAEAENELAGARRTLLAMIGGDVTEAVEIDAVLTTSAPEPLAVLLERARATRSVLELQKSAADAAETASARAAWAWIPNAALIGGARRTSDRDAEWGYVAGVSLEIPLISRGQDVAAEADARAAVERARLDRTQREIHLRVVGSFDRLAAAHREIARLSAARKSVEALERAASSGYREGARNILELIDAQQARRQLELRRLEWSRRAKRAEISLRAAMGEFE